MSFFYMFIHCFVRSSDKYNQIPDGGIQDNYVQTAVKYIQHHYYKDISVEDIAAHCSIHRSYLSRIFKASMDITLQEFLIKYRLDMACELLKTTNHSILAISNMVGYTNQFNFSRTFKKEKGVSPQNWRK